MATRIQSSSANLELGQGDSKTGRDGWNHTGQAGKGKFPAAGVKFRD
jgi:hypothetical protein